MSTDHTPMTDAVAHFPWFTLSEKVDANFARALEVRMKQLKEEVLLEKQNKIAHWNQLLAARDELAKESARLDYLLSFSAPSYSRAELDLDMRRRRA